MKINSKELFLRNQPVFTECIGEHRVRQYILYKMYIIFSLLEGFKHLLL